MPASAPAGPLAGQTLAVKDLIDVRGLPTGAGHPTWLATHPPATADAPVVRRLIAAGATLVGKTHTDEFAYSLFGTNAHYGAQDNPAAPGHLTGGSSSGAAAAVAGGFATLGLGTDTAGSVRVPAAWCGLYGLRPTHSRVSRSGIVPLGPSFDVAGLMTVDLATLAAAAPALLLHRALDAPITGVRAPADLWALADPAVAEALWPAVAALGLPVNDTPLWIQGEPAPDYPDAYSVRQGWEFWQAHGGWITAHRPTFGPHVTTRVAAAARRTESEVAAADTVRASVAGALQRALAGDTIIALPTVPVPAPPHGFVASAELRRRILLLTLLASMGGLPGLTLPVATVEGRPVGLSLLDLPGGDERLLALASAAGDQLNMVG
jgi:amidase